MALTKQEVEHIAALARIELTEQEKKKFQKELSSILEYIDQLKEVDTSKVESTAEVHGLTNVFREDEIEECGAETREEMLKQAPMREGDYVKTKSVFG